MLAHLDMSLCSFRIFPATCFARDRNCYGILGGYYLWAVPRFVSTHAIYESKFMRFTPWSLKEGPSTYLFAVVRRSSFHTSTPLYIWMRICGTQVRGHLGYLVPPFNFGFRFSSSMSFKQKCKSSFVFIFVFLATSAFNKIYFEDLKKIKFQC